MNGQSSRLSLALDFVCAAAIILFGPAPQKRAQAFVTPLEEEFADIFHPSPPKRSGPHYGRRLAATALTDLSDLPHYSQVIHKRLTLLRRTSVMPSAIVRAVAARIGVPASVRPRPSLLSWDKRGVASAVAREIKADERFVQMCWREEVDLDAQWRALRNELLKIRRERAASA